MSESGDDRRVDLLGELGPPDVVKQDEYQNTFTLRRIVAAAVAAVAVAGAYVYERTQIARTELSQWGVVFDESERNFTYSEWEQRRGFFNLHGDLVNGEHANSYGLALKGHFEGSELEGPGYKLDPNGKTSKELLHSADAVEELGTFHEGKLHGHDCMRKRRDGTTINGDFAFGLPNGHEEIDFTDGSKLVGEFSNPKLEGPDARDQLRSGITVQSGTKLSISFDNLLQGLLQGRKTDSKGDVVFDGTFEGEVFTGYKKIDLNGFGVFEGQIKSDAANGHAKLTMEDGTILEGDFVDGCLPQANIVLDLVNGTFYRGEIQNNKPHGKGELVKIGGAVTWRGEFDNGVFVSGELTDSEGLKITGKFYPNGRLEKGHAVYAKNNAPAYDYSHSILEADYEFGVPNGSGKVFSRESVFEGQFLGGKFTYNDPEAQNTEEMIDKLLRDRYGG